MIEFAVAAIAELPRIFSQKAAFDCSFGTYFPHSFAQVQPRPSDISELLRLVKDLRQYGIRSTA
ncbi:hypothetical protein ACJRO7_009608 [Eucalyptus globulus]|uniref:Uncharacterized protein n=1 Tax=Eucalyptus globulus TaxID=34317 RepID=A0ABD3LA36_EUCGL